MISHRIHKMSWDIIMLKAHAWAADFGMKEMFLTTCSLSQTAPLSDPYKPSEFVKTILLYPVHLCSNFV